MCYDFRYFAKNAEKCRIIDSQDVVRFFPTFFLLLFLHIRKISICDECFARCVSRMQLETIKIGVKYLLLYQFYLVIDVPLIKAIFLRSILVLLLFPTIIDSITIMNLKSYSIELVDGVCCQSMISCAKPIFMSTLNSGK